MNSTTGKYCSVVYFLFIYLHFYRENNVSHHVVGRTEQLPSELIVNSQGTEIFSQELPRVSCAYYFTQLEPAAWKVDNAVYWINLHFVDRSLARCQ